MWGDKGPLTRAALSRRFTEHYILFIKLVLLGLLSPEPALKGLDEKTTLISASNQERQAGTPRSMVLDASPPAPLLCPTKSFFAPVPSIPKLSILPQTRRLAEPPPFLPLLDGLLVRSLYPCKLRHLGAAPILSR